MNRCDRGSSTQLETRTRLLREDVREIPTLPLREDAASAPIASWPDLTPRLGVGTHARTTSGVMMGVDAHACNTYDNVTAYKMRFAHDVSSCYGMPTGRQRLFKSTTSYQRMQTGTASANMHRHQNVTHRDPASTSVRSVLIEVSLQTHA